VRKTPTIYPDISAALQQNVKYIWLSALYPLVKAATRPIFRLIASNMTGLGRIAAIAGSQSLCHGSASAWGSDYASIWARSHCVMGRLVHGLVLMLVYGLVLGLVIGRLVLPSDQIALE
jgi:hypothetical protein